MPMNCEQARTHLDRFLDAEVDASTLAAVNEHLAGCAECRAVFNREGRLQVGVRTVLRDEAMPADLWTRLAGALEDAERRTGGNWPLRALLAPARLRLLGRWALGLAGIAAGTLLAIHITRRPEKPYPGIVTRTEGAELARVHFEFDARSPHGRERDIPLSTHVGEFLTRAWRIRLPAEGPHKVLSVFHEVIQFDGRRVLHVGYNCCGNPTSVYVVPDFVGSVEMVAELGREAGQSGRSFAHKRIGRAWIVAVADNRHDVGFLLETFVKEPAPG